MEVFDSSFFMVAIDCILLKCRAHVIGMLARVVLRHLPLVRLPGSLVVQGFLAICAFGLPGRTHEDGPARGIQAALSIVEGMKASGAALQRHVLAWVERMHTRVMASFRLLGRLNGVWTGLVSEVQGRL